MAASLVNPYGIGLHRHVASYLSSDWIRNAVEEFQSPKFRSEALLHFEILLFAALIWRVLVCAWRSKDPFGTLFGAGLATMILVQVFVNVGMVVGILPVTGIPLPFITHGGASLVSIAIGLGVIQSINIRQRRAEW